MKVINSLDSLKDSLMELRELPRTDRQTVIVHKSLNHLIDQTLPKNMHKWRFIQLLLFLGLKAFMDEQAREQASMPQKVA